MTSSFTPPAPLQTAVLFLVFNRPDTTAQVFEAIRQAKPPRLYVAADGPREDKEGEAERVAKVREIVTAVDWPCEVKTLFREENLGCKCAVSSAITWFFEQEEQGIILEDDCLPSQSFFWFCEELLERYKKDTRIFMISGYNYKGAFGCSDYFFSNIGGIWGWATWNRAWSHYKREIKDIEIRYGAQFSKLKYLLGPLVYKKRQSHWVALQEGLDTWDYQWSFIRHFNNGLSCIPNLNLVKNIGFGPDATHTKGKVDTPNAYDMVLPTSKNYCLLADREYDDDIHESSGKLITLTRIIGCIKKMATYMVNYVKKNKI